MGGDRGRRTEVRSAVGGDRVISERFSRTGKLAMFGQERLSHLRKLALERLEDRRLLSVDSSLERFNASPALFVENAGQWADSSIRFMHQGDGANVAMTDAGPVFQVSRSRLAGGSEGDETLVDAPDAQARQVPPGRRDLREKTETLQFSASFVGANRATLVGREPAKTQFNYFVGERSNWRTAAPSYATVVYEDLYSGVELQAWGQRDSLKYEFHVAPGADFRQVQVRYAGINSLSIAGDGSLHINPGDGWGELIDDAPYVYQIIDGRQSAVAAQFQLIDSQTYAFAISGEYDPQRELVIDPDLAWATYLGGTSGDYGYGVSMDDADNAFVTGYTASANFAGANNGIAGGNSDAFVAKVSSQGTLLWATYLGGSADDYSYAIAVDAAGDAYVTGNTNSPTFAGANNEYHGGAYDAFAAKVSVAGVLQWTTFLGGGGYDYGYGIAVDAAGDAFVTGQTTSGNFAGANNASKGGTDAFAAKIATAGTLVWTTYLGGSVNDIGRGIAVDNAENVFVTGNTASTNFAGRNNSFKGGDMDAFVAKISAGALTWSTYLGGNGNDFGYGVTVDPSNNVVVAGSTTSTDFSGTNNTVKGGIDAFAAKIGSGGTIGWASYLGGSKDDIGYGVAVSAAGSLFVCGSTSSADFSGASDAYHGGNYDGFAAKLSATGIFAWSTFLGGFYDDVARDLCVNVNGVAFVTGQTTSANFSSANNSAKGSIDAFTARLDDRPRAPDLATGSDTGANDADDITYVDNSAADKALTFAVRETVAGATVTIYADGIAIGSATAQSATTSVVTNGAFDLTDGAHVITARQTEPGQAESAASDALTVTIDTTLPTVSVEQAASQCDPTAGSPIHFTLRASEPLFEFAANDITLSGTAATAKAAVAGSGTLYDVIVSGMTSSGKVIAALLAAAAHDIAGNASAASTSVDNVVLYNVATRVWNGRGTDGNLSTADNWGGRDTPSNGDNLMFPADAAAFDVIDGLPAGTRLCSVVIAGGNYRFQHPLLNTSTVRVLGGAALTVDSIACDNLSIGANVPGATKTWSGKGTDNKWTTPANWVGDKAPSPGDSLVFPAGVAQLDSAVDLPPEMNLASITAPAVKLEGQAVLTAASIACDSLTIGKKSATAGKLALPAIAVVAAASRADESRATGAYLETREVDRTTVEQSLAHEAGLATAPPVFSVSVPRTPTDRRTVFSTITTAGRGISTIGREAAATALERTSFDEAARVGLYFATHSADSAWDSTVLPTIMRTTRTRQAGTEPVKKAESAARTTLLSGDLAERPRHSNSRRPLRLPVRREILSEIQETGISPLYP
jgi:hypothetical protein